MELGRSGPMRPSANRVLLDDREVLSMSSMKDVSSLDVVYIGYEGSSLTLMAGHRHLEATPWRDCPEGQVP